MHLGGVGVAVDLEPSVLDRKGRDQARKVDCFRDLGLGRPMGGGQLAVEKNPVGAAGGGRHRHADEFFVAVGDHALAELQALGEIPFRTEQLIGDVFEEGGDVSEHLSHLRLDLVSPQHRCLRG